MPDVIYFVLSRWGVVSSGRLLLLWLEKGELAVFFGRFVGSFVYNIANISGDPGYSDCAFFFYLLV